MSILSSLIASLFIFYPKPGKDAFLIILIAYSLAVCYVDALAEGISSIVTKLNEKIAILEAGGKTKVKDESMKALGLFSSFRGILQGVMALVGGYVVQVTHKSHLMVTGFILASYPILFCIQTFFIFKEKKVRKQKEKRKEQQQKIIKIDKINHFARKRSFSPVVATSEWE